MTPLLYSKSGRPSPLQIPTNLHDATPRSSSSPGSAPSSPCLARSPGSGRSALAGPLTQLADQDSEAEECARALMGAAGDGAIRISAVLKAVEGVAGPGQFSERAVRAAFGLATGAQVDKARFVAYLVNNWVEPPGRPEADLAQGSLRLVDVIRTHCRTLAERSTGKAAPAQKLPTRAPHAMYVQATSSAPALHINGRQSPLPTALPASVPASPVNRGVAGREEASPTAAAGAGFDGSSHSAPLPQARSSPAAYQASVIRARAERGSVGARRHSVDAPGHDVTVNHSLSMGGVACPSLGGSGSGTLSRLRRSSLVMLGAAASSRLPQQPAGSPPALRSPSCASRSASLPHPLPPSLWSSAGERFPEGSSSGLPTSTVSPALYLLAAGSNDSLKDEGDAVASGSWAPPSPRTTWTLCPPALSAHQLALSPGAAPAPRSFPPPPPWLSPSAQQPSPRSVPAVPGLVSILPAFPRSPPAPVPPDDGSESPTSRHGAAGLPEPRLSPSGRQPRRLSVTFAPDVVYVERDGEPEGGPRPQTPQVTGGAPVPDPRIPWPQLPAPRYPACCAAGDSDGGLGADDGLGADGGSGADGVEAGEVGASEGQGEIEPAVEAVAMGAGGRAKVKAAMSALIGKRLTRFMFRESSDGSVPPSQLLAEAELRLKMAQKQLQGLELRQQRAVLSASGRG